MVWSVERYVRIIEVSRLERIVCNIAWQRTARPHNSYEALYIRMYMILSLQDCCHLIILT